VGTLIGNPPAGALVGAAVGQKYGKQIGSGLGGNLGERAGAYIGGRSCGYSMPSLESLEGPIGVDGPCGGGGQATLMRAMMA
jgi:hypothetical protein